MSTNSKNPNYIQYNFLLSQIDTLIYLFFKLFKGNGKIKFLEIK